IPSMAARELDHSGDRRVPLRIGHLPSSPLEVGHRACRKNHEQAATLEMAKRLAYPGRVRPSAIDWNQQSPELRERREDSIRNKLQIGAHTAQNCRKDGGLEDPERMISNHDRGATPGNPFQIAARNAIADFEELE